MTHGRPTRAAHLHSTSFSCHLVPVPRRMRERSRRPALRRLGFPTLPSLLNLLLAVPPAVEHLGCTTATPHSCSSRGTPVPGCWAEVVFRPLPLGEWLPSLGYPHPRTAPPLREPFLAWAVIDPTRGRGIISGGFRLALPCRQVTRTGHCQSGASLGSDYEWARRQRTRV